MEMKWLKTFMIAAQTENFRKTSEELFLTQPAVTKHVQRLEEFLQIQLFQRNGKKVHLTPAGYRFLKHAQTIVSAYDEGMKDFQAWKQGYDKKLTIAVAPQIAASILPSLLRDFISQHPSIEVMINIVKSFEIGEEINAGRADLGLTRMKPVQPNLNCIMIHEENVILVAPNEGRRENNFYCEKNMLQKYRLITDNHPEYWDTLIVEVKKHYPNVQTMKVNQIEVTKRFIEEGFGVSYLPITMVKEEIMEKKMIEVLEEKVCPSKSLTYLVTKIDTEEVKLFSTFIKQKRLERGGISL
ncbi:MAG TPA: LysR family transcriptional regulator [Bacillus bacterium]|nr:LysR family transcriptional regulator [Bacillus sp. (in: firmicutes)]